MSQNSTLKYPYDQCHICRGAIAFPGLDAFKCGGECARWVSVSQAAHQVLPPLSAPSPKQLSRPLLSLSAQGGEA